MRRHSSLQRSCSTSFRVITVKSPRRNVCTIIQGYQWSAYVPVMCAQGGAERHWTDSENPIDCHCQQVVMLLIAQDVLLHRYASKIKFSDKTRTHTHTPIYTIIHKYTHTHNRDHQFRSSAEVQSKFCDHRHQNDKNVKIILVGGGVTWMTFHLSCVYPTFYLPSDGTPCEPQTVLTKLKSHDCWLGRTLKSWHFYFDAASVCDITEGFKSQGFLRYHSAAVSPPCRLLVLTNVWSGVTDTRQQWFHCLIWNAALMLHHSIYKCVFKCVRASVCVCV